MNVLNTRTLMRDDRTSDAIERFEQKGRGQQILSACERTKALMKHGPLTEVPHSFFTSYGVVRSPSVKVTSH